MDKLTRLPLRKIVSLSIILLIASAHLIPVESYLNEGLQHLYFSYFSDLVLPFGFYFLLFFPERQLPILGRWEVKAAVVFLAPSIAETCQYFGLPVLGSTFDLLDYVMYALGTALAILVDTLVFSRIFNYGKLT